MARESDLVNPVADWLRCTFGPNRILLIHEETQGRGGRRPDLLAVFAEEGSDRVDEVNVVPVEIEVSSRAALHDPRNGLGQLRKYPGHAKFLAIPRTVARRQEASQVPVRCRKQGVGFLVVDLSTGEVFCEVEPAWVEAKHGLRYYPKAKDRWIALRESNDAFRRISGRRIVERGGI